jgi:ADP-ribose pyrophosphatase
VSEKITRTQSIYEGRVVKLALLDVELQDGSQSKRELVRHPGAVAVVALDEARHVLLVRQFRIAAGKLLLEIPAGTLEPDEAPLTCAERELQEETGYRPGKIEAMGGLFVAPGYTTEYIHLFFATDLSESRLQADADEFIEVERIPLADAVAMIERGEIIDGKSIAGLLRVARRLGM